MYLEDVSMWFSVLGKKKNGYSTVVSEGSYLTARDENCLRF